MKIYFMLKKSLLFLLLIICFFVSGNLISTAAQSGRKVAPSPTPRSNLPKVVVTTPGDDITFSESNPRKLPAIYVSPKKREKIRKQINSAKDNKQPNKNSAEPPVAVTTDEDAIKIETDLITIPVSVYDRNGVYIPNLRKEDFKIFEDGKEQEIAYFGAQDKPFTVILLIDTSPSTAYKIEEIQAAARRFVEELQPQDQVMVVEFDANVHVLTEATGDRQRIFKAIGKADFGSGTSIYDAIDFSLRKRLSKLEGRKAIVLFTDGVDTTSIRGYDETVFESEEADALIFPIYYNTFLDPRPQQFGIYGGIQMPGTLRRTTRSAKNISRI